MTDEARIAELERRVDTLEEDKERLVDILETLVENGVSESDVRDIVSEEIEGEVGDGVENALRDVFGPAAETEPDGRMFQ